MRNSRGVVVGVTVGVSVLTGVVGGFLADGWVWGVAAVGGVDGSRVARVRAGGLVVVVVASCALLAVVVGTGLPAWRPGGYLAGRPGLPSAAVYPARQPPTMSGSSAGSAPSVVLLRYIDAMFHDRRDDLARLWECGSPHLAAIDARVSDVRGWEVRYRVSMTVQATDLVVSSWTATTAGIDSNLTISVSTPGASEVDQRLTQPWHFDLVQETGWRVCAARPTEPPPSTPAGRPSRPRG